MVDGLATYKRLKAHLDMRNVSVTKFAASLGTSPQTLMDVVVRWAGREDTPKKETTQKVMAAVAEELAKNLAIAEADDD